MTTATFATSRPYNFAGGGELKFLDPVAKLRRVWTDYRDYRRTLATLRALSIRQREDVGIVGHDLKAVARAANYGI